MRLSRYQREVLEVLREAGQPIGVGEVARLTRRPPTGVASTASSLIRHGLAERELVRVGGKRYVMYRAVATSEAREGKDR